MMRCAVMLRVVLGAALAFAIAGSNAEPAVASCIGPTVALDRPPVWRGAVVTVRGEGWGDGSCYDTDAPPLRESALGKPASEIEVAFEQGGRRVVVAHGSADATYRFTARIVVPSELDAGPAVLAASTAASNGTAVVWFAVTIESERAVPSAEVVVTTFGAAAAATSTTVMSASASASASTAAIAARSNAGGAGWLVGALVAALVGVLALLAFVSHQRRTSVSERPDGLGPAD